MAYNSMFAVHFAHANSAVGGALQTRDTSGRSSAIKDIADTSALVSLALKER